MGNKSPTKSSAPTVPPPQLGKSTQTPSTMKKKEPVNSNSTSASSPAPPSPQTPRSGSRIRSSADIRSSKDDIIDTFQGMGEKKGSAIMSLEKKGSAFSLKDALHAPEPSPKHNVARASGDTPASPSGKSTPVLDSPLKSLGGKHFSFRKPKSSPAPKLEDEDFEFSNPLTDHLVAQPLQRSLGDSASPLSKVPSPLLAPRAKSASVRLAVDTRSKSDSTTTPVNSDSEPPPTPTSGRSEPAAEASPKAVDDVRPKSLMSPMAQSLQRELFAKLKEQPGKKIVVDESGNVKHPKLARNKSKLLPSKALVDRVNRYLSPLDVSSVDHVSLSEQAFLPGDLVRRLGQAAGQLPPTPAVFAGSGAVLFVDVTGFTALSEQLTKDLVPVQAAEKLAFIIRKVLEMLAEACLDGGGQIAKFAGDALLCTFDGEDDAGAASNAQRVAINMLHRLDELNAKERTALQIHGGIARGAILHFHLGSVDDDLRTYVIAGEALSAATTLVDVAKPGEFAVLVSGGSGNTDAHADSPLRQRCVQGRRRRLTLQAEGLALDALATEEGESLLLTTQHRRASVAPVQPSLKKPLPAPKLLTLNKASVPPPFTPSKSIPAVPLPRECSCYVPTALRGKLEQWEARTEHSLKVRCTSRWALMHQNAFRRRVAILFAENEDLRLTEAELRSRSVPEDKLRALDSSYVTMTRITQAFGGEVRDMLFDDKGCIFIAAFGAHSDEEIDSDNRWIDGAVKTALAINIEVPRARMGVTVGTCFVGMVGALGRRTDFCVIGHEVNLAARYMAAAEPGQILVSSAIKQFASEAIAFGPAVQVEVGKKDKKKSHTVYSPLLPGKALAPFRAQYRPKMRYPSTFVGRDEELKRVRERLLELEHNQGFGVVLVQGPAGRGKQALVKRVKGMGCGRVKIASGRALQGEQRPLYALSQALAAYTGVLPALSDEDVGLAVRREPGLGLLLPWTGKAWEGADAAAQAKALAGLVKQPSVLVLEDVQWLDEQSARVVHELLRLRPRGLLLLLSGRDGAPLVTSARAAPGALVLDLPPLSEAASDLLLSKLLAGRQVSPEACEWMFKASKGEPLFVELAAAWLQAKHVKPGDEAAALQLQTQWEAGGARAVVASHLMLLPAPVQDMVRVAAHAPGAAVDSEFVAEVARLAIDPAKFSDTAVSHGMDVLAAGGLLLPLGRPDAKHPMRAKWQFRHEVEQRALMDLTPADKRALIAASAAKVGEDMLVRLREVVVNEEND